GADDIDDMFNTVGFVKDMKTGTTTDILDLAVVAKLGPSVFWPRGGETEVLHSLRNPLPRFIYLRLDMSSSPTALINSLRPLLTNRHSQYRDTAIIDHPLERLHKEIRYASSLDIPTWIDYFKCYDLWWCDRLSYSQISHKVYGTPKSRGRAK